jgi:hypothetical protein
MRYRIWVILEKSVSIVVARANCYHSRCQHPPCEDEQNQGVNHVLRARLCQGEKKESLEPQPPRDSSRAFGVKIVDQSRCDEYITQR